MNNVVLMKTVYIESDILIRRRTGKKEFGTYEVISDKEGLRTSCNLCDNSAGDGCDWEIVTS